jgi:NAD/NADP transhydrogenase alpha subunit
VVGDVLMSTVPVVNVFAGTDAVSVKTASTLMLSSATNAASTMIVAKSFRAISSVLSNRVWLGLIPALVRVSSIWTGLTGNRYLNALVYVTYFSICEHPS